MMKKIVILLIIMVISLCFLCSCAGPDTVVFSKKVSNSFDGLGVEWGVYEDTNKLASNAKERIIQAVDRLRPALVRCMLNYDWIVENFDDKGNDDLNDDTWTYNFTNKYMTNCCDILDYCQDHGIKVALGVWSPIGSADEKVDVWKMIPNATSDIRWAKMTGDMLDYLVNNKGYTCIRWFVNSNEPNYVGAIGSSKNAYNTYEKWQQGVLNVRKVLDSLGLTDIDIVGGDTTGFNGSAEYLPQIAQNLSGVVNNYGVHFYISNYNIDSASYQADLQKLYDAVKGYDKNLGVTKPLLIWEAGLLDGKNMLTDSNSYIANYSYGLRMADYTVQSVLAGVNGIAFWDLDDAMHFMYTEQGSTPKEWGMFSTLASSTSFKQEYRPWFHSTVMLSNLMRPGCAVYAPNATMEAFRTLATVSADGKDAGVVAINRATTAVTKSFKLQTKVEASQKLYVYIFNEKDLRLGENGFVVPFAVLDEDINNGFSIEIPANSMVIVSTSQL